jgi:hypothetical protein
MAQAFLGIVHAENTPVYRAQILPPDAEFPSNGLPVFHLTWRNDDGGPGYGVSVGLNGVLVTETKPAARLRCGPRSGPSRSSSRSTW